MQVPSNLPENITIVSLGHHGLTRIGRNDFNGMAALDQLFVNDNVIKVIEDGSFRSLESLTWINLENNRLVHLSPSTFVGLINLRYLRLENNTNLMLKECSFAGLPKLKKETVTLSGTGVNFSLPFYISDGCRERPFNFEAFTPSYFVTSPTPSFVSTVNLQSEGAATNVITLLVIIMCSTVIVVAVTSAIIVILYTARERVLSSVRMIATSPSSEEGGADGNGESYDDVIASNNPVDIPVYTEVDPNYEKAIHNESARSETPPNSRDIPLPLSAVSSNRSDSFQPGDETDLGSSDVGSTSHATYY